MHIAKTNYSKTQNDPNITNIYVHITDVSEILPVFNEPFDSVLGTSIAAGILTGMKSSSSIHNGNPIRNILKDTNENKLFNILNSQLTTVYLWLSLPSPRLLSEAWNSLHL